MKAPMILEDVRFNTPRIDRSAIAQFRAFPTRRCSGATSGLQKVE